MIVRLVAIIALLVVPGAAQAGVSAPITKALPAVQSVGMAPNLKIVFTQPQNSGPTDPAEDWPGHPDDCEGGCDAPSPPGSDDPSDEDDRP